MLAPAGKGGRGDLMMYSFFFVIFCFASLLMLAPAGKGGRGDLMMDRHPVESQLSFKLLCCRLS